MTIWEGQEQSKEYLKKKRFVAKSDSELIILYALNKNNDKWNVKKTQQYIIASESKTHKHQ